MINSYLKVGLYCLLNYERLTFAKKMFKRILVLKVICFKHSEFAYLVLKISIVLWLHFKLKLLAYN